MKTNFTFIRRFAILAVLIGGLLLGFANGALAATIQGGTFHVNSNADNIDKDNYVTLREAMIFALGGTGGGGLNREVTTAEKKLLHGCSFSLDSATGDWNADPKCGKGDDTIVFKLTGCPCNIYPLTPLPALQSDSIDGYSQSGSAVNTSKNGMNAKIMVHLLGDVAAPGVDGLHIIGSSSTVKGLAIADFGGFGMYIAGSNSHILGDLVYNNGKNGIMMDGGTNFIGNMTLAGRNSIYANAWHGIEGFPTAGNSSIVNNLIGLAPDPHTPSPGNHFSGISIYSSNNVIEHNRIANNENNGILILTGTQNIFDDNAIFNNGWLGVDLGNNGVTLNDDSAKDADSGANTLQNYPELGSAHHATNSVKGKLFSTPNTTFQLSFYANPGCDSSGHGQGKTYLGGLQVHTNGAGTAKFNVTLGKKFGAGNAVTALASTSTGTSEFSQCVTAQ
jgi:parallel beta-helix repeat protein